MLTAQPLTSTVAALYRKTVNAQPPADRKSQPLALIIDDDPYLSKVICSLLKLDQYKCKVAPTGSQGLQAMARSRPDVVLLDLLLPDMDGFEVITRMRKISDTPILVITALPVMQNKSRALELGANDYLSKPFEIDALIGKVKALTQRQA